MSKELSKIIKDGAGMGYSAEVVDATESEKGVVVAYAEGGIVVRWGTAYCQFYHEDAIKTFKITGWKYVGELFGENKIEEGQKFRVKETGLIKSYVGKSHNHIDLRDREFGLLPFRQSEIEPIFT